MRNFTVFQNDPGSFILIKSNIFPPYPRQTPTGLASMINIFRVTHGKKYAL